MYTRFKKTPLAFAATIVMAGCVQIMGYEYPVHCRLNSDCPPDHPHCSLTGECTVECNANVDCLDGKTCSPEHVCVSAPATTREPPDASGASSSETGTPDALAPAVDAADAADVAEGGCGDVSHDPKNCGQCGNACVTGYCEESRCLAPTAYGAYATSAAPTQPFQVVGPVETDGGLGVMTGILIHVAQPGWLLKLGLLADFGGARAYLGLYTSVDNQPGTLVASTDEFTLNGPPLSSNPVADPSPTVVDVPATRVVAADYWIVGMWSQLVYLVSSARDSTCASSSLNCVEQYMLSVPYGPLPSIATPVASLGKVGDPILYAVVGQ